MQSNITYTLSGSLCIINNTSTNANMIDGYTCSPGDLVCISQPSPYNTYNGIYQYNGFISGSYKFTQLYTVNQIYSCFCQNGIRGKNAVFYANLSNLMFNCWFINPCNVVVNEYSILTTTTNTYNNILLNLSQINLATAQFCWKNIMIFGTPASSGGSNPFSFDLGLNGNNYYGSYTYDRISGANNYGPLMRISNIQNVNPIIQGSNLTLKITTSASSQPANVICYVEGYWLV